MGFEETLQDLFGFDSATYVGTALSSALCLVGVLNTVSGPWRLGESHRQCPRPMHNAGRVSLLASPPGLAQCLEHGRQQVKEGSRGRG